MSAGQQRESAGSAEPAPSAPKRSRGRRWTRALLILIAVMLVLRIGLAIALPMVLDRWAKSLGLACTYERLDLSPLRGRIDLWHLVLEPRRDAEAASTGDHVPQKSSKGIADEIVHLEYATVDVDLGALLTFAFKLDRVEIDGLELHAVRESDGRLNFMRYLAAMQSTEPPARPAAGTSAPPTRANATQATEPPAPLHLAPPIAIAAVRLQRVRLHYEDAHVNPPIDARLDLDVSASDIGSKLRPLHAEITALSPENLCSLFLEAHCAGDDSTLHGDFGIALEVFRPQAFGGYLETIGISPYAKQISFKLRGDLDVAVQGERKNEARAKLVLRGLKLGDDLDEALGLDALTCEVDSISVQSAHVSRIEIAGLRATAARLASGALRIAGIDLSLADSGTTSPAATPAVVASTTGDAGGYPCRIDQLLLENGTIRFQDAAVEPHADVALELHELEIDHVATDAAQANVPITVRALLHAPRIAANVKLDGDIAWFSHHKAVNLALSADNITLEAIAPYMRAAKLAPDLTDGSLKCKISGTADEDANGALRGRLQLDGFALKDVDEVCAIDKIAIEEILIDPARALVRLGSVEVAGTRGGFDRDPNLSVHMLGLRTIPPAELASAPRSASTAAVSIPPAPSLPSSGQSGRTPTGASTPSAHSQPASAPSANPPTTSATTASATTTGALITSTPTTSTPTTSTGATSTGATSTGATNLGSASNTNSRFELGKLVWHESSLRYRDRALEPELALTFADAKVEAQDLAFGGALGDPARPPAKIHMLLHAPGLAENLECTAVIESRPGPIDLAFDVDLKGEGMRAGEISPYLLDQGIDSKLDGAELSFALKANLKAEAGGVGLGFSLERFELRNAGQSIASIDAVRLRDAHILTDAIRIGEVSIENPHAAISRDATGALILGGVRFVPPTPPRPGHRAPPPIFEPLLEPLNDFVASHLADKEVIVERVRTTGVDVHWSDASVSPPVDLHALVGLKTDHFIMGKAATPASLALELAVPGALEKMALDGTFSLAPDNWSASLSFEAQGLDAGPLAAYLPPGHAGDLHGGSLAFHLQASTSTASEGGARAALELRDLLYRSGNAVQLFKMGALVLRVGRADPAARVFRIDELSVAGIESSARRDVDGNIHVLGLSLGSAKQPAADTTASIEPASVQSSGISSASVSTPVAPNQVASALGASAAVTPPSLPIPPTTADALPPNLMWQAQVTPPTVRLEKFEIGIEKLTFIDETHAEGALPIVGSMHIAIAGPTAILDANPGDLPPIHFDVHGSIEPIVKEIDLALDVSPFADEPAITAVFAAHGLRGQGLTEVAPELAARIDGSGLTEGDLAGHLGLEIEMERRSSMGFDFQRSFGLTLELDDMSFKDRPGGSILAGLDSLSIVADRIVPATGDMHVASIDLIKPRAVLSKQTDGLHLFGLIVRPIAPAQAPPADAATGAAPASAPSGSDGAPAQAASQSPAQATSASPAQATSASPAQATSASPAQGTSASTAQATAASPAQAAPASTSQATPPTSAAAPESSSSAPASPAPAKFEVRVDEFSISGIDVDIRDDSVTPPFALPLVDLEVNVYRFSTRAFEEPIPVRFSVFLAAGDVALPKRAREGGSLTSFVTDLPGVSTVTDLVSRPNGGQPVTMHPAFDELSASGVVTFVPRITGRVTTDLRSLQLLNFAGLAENSKITIDDGTMDSRVKVEVDSTQGAKVEARFRFSDLSLSEPMGGPIQKYLLLPAPLDQVLFVLRDSNGDQVVPLSFEVQGTAITTGQITKTAVTTFSELVAKAIANAPLRILSWIGSWFGIGTSKREELAKQVRSFRLEPGDAALSDQAVREIGPLIDLLNSDSDTMLVVRPELGVGDLARAEVLANPTPEQCREIVARLQQERAELLRRSAELESQASALWSVGREDLATATSDRLRSVGRHVGETEQTLDRMLDLMRPGAERYRNRRTHAACRVIGAQRIASLRALLEARGVKDVSERMDVRTLRPEPTAGQGGGRITLVPRLRGGP